MNELEKSYAKHIAEEYAPKTATKVVQLQKLDKKVKQPVKIAAYITGAIASLIAGAGMSMLMTDFGLEGTPGVILGMALGVVGLFVCVINYPLYKKILNSRKKKYAFEIIELAKEIENN